MDPTADSDRIRWITVFTAPMSEAIVCQGLLESNGMPTRILDEHIKFIDPFITGGEAFRVELQTPPEWADKAREVLSWRPPRLIDDDDHVEPERARVEKIGQRIRWASITILTAPYALWLAPRYLIAAGKLGRTPRNYGWTLAAIAFSCVMTLAAAAVYLRK